MSAWLWAFIEMLALALIFWVLSLIFGQPLTAQSLTFGVAFAALVRTHRLRLAA